VIGLLSIVLPHQIMLTLIFHLQYASIHGIPIGWSAHHDRIAFVIETGDSQFNQKYISRKI